MLMKAACVGPSCCGEELVGVGVGGGGGGGVGAGSDGGAGCCSAASSCAWATPSWSKACERAFSYGIRDGRSGCSDCLRQSNPLEN